MNRFHLYALVFFTLYLAGVACGFAADGNIIRFLPAVLMTLTMGAMTVDLWLKTRHDE